VLIVKLQPEECTTVPKLKLSEKCRSREQYNKTVSDVSSNRKRLCQTRNMTNRN